MMIRKFAVLAILATPQWTVPLHVPAGLTSACTGLPAYTASYKSTTPAGGGGATVSSWTDSSGNGHTLTFSATLPTIDTVNIPPDGQQTIQFGSIAPGTLTALSNSSSMTVVFIGKQGDVSTKRTLTSNTGAGGSFAYYPNAASSTAQGADASVTAAIGQATEAPNITSFTTNIVSWTASTAINFYRWNASFSGADATASGPGTTTTSAGINQLFANNGPAEGFVGSVLELDIIVGTAINSTQAAAIHSCAVSTYGIP